MNDRRGQPILFLALLVAGWLLLRVVMWESPWAERALASTTLAHGDPAIAVAQQGSPRALAAARQGPAPRPVMAAKDRRPAPAPGGREPQAARTPRSLVVAQWPSSDPAAPPAPSPNPGPESLAIDPAPAVGAASGPRVRPEPRWRVDGWLVLRDAGLPAAQGGDRPATYGASQAGAVVSYRLAPSSRRDPAAYVRATKALSGDREGAIALGLSARPIARVPLTAHVELRTGAAERGTEVRPAAFVAGGMDTVRLPLALGVSGYVQAGYVGGRFATGFADGSAALTHRLALPVPDPPEMRIGLGAWGGVQRDAARLDIGPSASIDLDLGRGGARIVADYRFRVAGNAQPRAGPALTIIGGF